MNQAGTLTRDALFESIEDYRHDPEFARWRDAYLERAVHQKDVPFVRLLLGAGAGPDVVTSCSDSLQHYLVHEYLTVRTLQGNAVVEILDLLLSHGADPEHVGCNNWRGIDVAIDLNIPVLRNVFIRHGAKPEQREFR